VLLITVTMRLVVSRTPGIAAALILVVACGTATAARNADPASSGLHTDRTAYVATRVGGEGVYTQYGFRVEARFNNMSRDTLYLARCYPESPTPIYGVELVDTPAASFREGAAYSGAWACVGHDRQIAVAPHSSRVDTLLIRGPNAWDGVSHIPFGTLTGRMRLRYEVQRCRGDGACAASGDAGRSNPFDVVRE
jgi:hypothetical protein